MSTEIVKLTSGALAVAADQTAWTDQQVAVLRSLGVDEEKVTQAEMDVFLHECQRTALDPFTKQIYLIGRYDSRAGREVFRSQTGIDGYRVVAHRAARRDHVELSYSDTMWCGPDGTWREVWLDRDQPPLAAKVTVCRNDKPFPAIATLAEYAATYKNGDPTPMWRRMPSTMLAKCAEALALRKAFPQDLAGIYTAEEMEQADNQIRQAPTFEPAPKERSVPRQAPPVVEDDPWQTPVQSTPAAVEPEYAEVVEQPAPVVHLVPDLAKALRLVRGAESDEAQYRALSQILGHEVAVGELVPLEDVGRALEALRGEYRQNAKQRQQDEREAARNAERTIAAGPTPDDPTLSAGKSRAMHAMFRERGMESSEAKHEFITRVLGHDIETMAEITRSQGEAVIKALTTGEIPGSAPQPAGIAPSDEGFDEFTALAQMIDDVHDEASFVEAQQAIDAETAAGNISAEDRDLLRERLAEVSGKVPAGVAS